MHLRSALLLLFAPVFGGCLVAGPPVYAQEVDSYYEPEVETFYEPGLEVYRVEGHPDCYFNQGYYYREEVGFWYRSHSFAGPWAAIEIDLLPRVFHLRGGSRYGRSYGGYGYGFQERRYDRDGWRGNRHDDRRDWRDRSHWRDDHGQGQWRGNDHRDGNDRNGGRDDHGQGQWRGNDHRDGNDRSGGRDDHGQGRWRGNDHRDGNDRSGGRDDHGQGQWRGGDHRQGDGRRDGRGGSGGGHDHGGRGRH